jgi:SAM-dependent methyltransferase
MMFGTREKFDYFLCSTCGCLQIDAIPAELSKYYSGGYYSLTAAPRGQAYASYPRAVLERARIGYALFGRGRLLAGFAEYLVDYPQEWHLVADVLKRCSLTDWDAAFLDIGCGTRSRWLESLKRLGFSSLTGVDPNIERDISYDGKHIHKGEAADLAGRFDLVTLHHSLEHIPEQVTTMKTVRALLKPTGLCVLRVPVVSSMVWDMYGTDWVELDAPRHLYLHSLTSIESVARHAGLTLVETIWDSTAFEFYGSEQYRRGIALTADNSYAIHPAKSDFTYREMAQFSALAEQANRQGRGGRACFYLRSASADRQP